MAGFDRGDDPRPLPSAPDCTCPAPPSTATGAWAKKAAVMAELHRLERRGVHQDQGWAYLRSGDLFDALRPLLARHGLVPTFRLEEAAARVITKKGRDGKAYETHLIRVSVACALVDSETGQRIDEATWPAEAHDGDKAIKAATSMAVAAWLGMAFLVSAGDADQAAGPPAEPSRPRRQAPPRPPQRKPAAASPTSSSLSPAETIRKQIGLMATKKTIPLAELEAAVHRLGCIGAYGACEDVGILRGILSYVNAWEPAPPAEEGDRS